VEARRPGRGLTPPLPAPRPRAPHPQVHLVTPLPFPPSLLNRWG
jgi:hypothetical protein